MNTRHCVHFASQGSVGSDSLALLRLSNNELTSISTYYRLAVNNGVVCWFVLGHQQPDYYTKEGSCGAAGGTRRFRETCCSGHPFLPTASG